MAVFGQEGRNKKQMNKQTNKQTNKMPVTVAMYHGCTIDHDSQFSQLVPDQHELHKHSPVSGLQRLPTPHGQKLAHSGPHLFP